MYKSALSLSPVLTHVFTMLVLAIDGSRGQSFFEKGSLTRAQASQAAFDTEAPGARLCAFAPSGVWCSVCGAGGLLAG